MILLIGVIAALSGLAAATFVQRTRCLDSGGRWDAAARGCQLATGASTGWSLAAVATGLVAAVGVGTLLFRAVLFVTGRAARSKGAAPPQ